MKKYLSIPLIAGALALALAACGGSNDYPASAENAFMDSCVAQDGATQAACGCMYDELKKNVSYHDFARADRAMRGGLDVDSDVQDAMLDAVDKCGGQA